MKFSIQSNPRLEVYKDHIKVFGDNSVNGHFNLNYVDIVKVVIMKANHPWWVFILEILSSILSFGGSINERAPDRLLIYLKNKILNTEEKVRIEIFRKEDTKQILKLFKSIIPKSHLEIYHDY